MTRKDYELLARVFAETRPDHGRRSGVQGFAQCRCGFEGTDEAVASHVVTGEAEYRAWERTIRALSDALQAENPRFDRSRFQYAATAPITITTPRWNADGSRKS